MNYTKLKPTKFNLENIRIGINSLKKINSYNHVQGLIIRNKKIIVWETKKGTKKMIQSIKKDKNNSAILIKYPKKKQDLRADLPTIGIDTLKDCKKFGINGIVLKSKQNIFLDKKESIKFANSNKIFINII